MNDAMRSGNAAYQRKARDTVLSSVLEDFPALFARVSTTDPAAKHSSLSGFENSSFSASNASTKLKTEKLCQNNRIIR
ncbi:hypothetical protein JOB18_033013 [Solea senegalensis]|uniref:Uncharacterized protein n=1 Tax=Solea senegalensis TaxID=28829 RepID=A0AAV6S2K9_SOLSE|nr:hypothetical protein JOB18_033013 [Solea senegalensis]